MLKPSSGFLFLAADHLHIDVSTALLVGDSVSDVLAGKAAGVRVLGLAKNDARALSLLEAGADDVAPLRHGRLL
jgi:beta-phosphoglucomutase-like phosphatase (HAD superfamily)